MKRVSKNNDKLNREREKSKKAEMSRRRTLSSEYDRD